MQPIYEIGYSYHNDIDRYVGHDPYFMVDNYDGWDISAEESGLEQYTLFTDYAKWLENKDIISNSANLADEVCLREEIGQNRLVVRTYEDEDYRIEIPKNLATYEPLPATDIYRCDICNTYMTWKCDIDDHESYLVEKIVQD